MIHVAQCLCPRRHCIVAAAYDPADTPDGLAALERTVQHLIADGGLNPWCGICYSRTLAWRYEDGETTFPSMEEALPHLRALEAANMATLSALQGGRN